MLLLLLILFLSSSYGFITRTHYGFRAVDEPFKYPTKHHIYGNFHQKNFVFSYKLKDELTGKDELDYAYCTMPNDTGLHFPTAIKSFIDPEGNVTIDNFIWKCVKTLENGKYSAEPFRCLYKMENGTDVEMMAGESSQTNNGSIKHHCDFANGGLRRVTEYVPGCFHDGKIYTVGQEWSEENPGDKNSSQGVMMGCHRGESGYFEKKVLGCIITKFSTKWEQLENDSYIETNETYTYKRFMQLNEIEFIFKNEDTGMERCVETEPGHVAVVKPTEEDIGCTFKNQFHKYLSYWDDLEMGAELTCGQFNKVIKNGCLINGTKYYTDPLREHKLSNGCIFICHDQKNIYKCPNQLSFLEVMKTATTKIPTTLRAEFGF